MASRRCGRRGRAARGGTGPSRRRRASSHERRPSAWGRARSMTSSAPVTLTTAGRRVAVLSRLRSSSRTEPHPPRERRSSTPRRASSWLSPQSCSCAQPLPSSIPSARLMAGPMPEESIDASRSDAMLLAWRSAVAPLSLRSNPGAPTTSRISCASSGARPDIAFPSNRRNTNGSAGDSASVSTSTVAVSPPVASPMSRFSSAGLRSSVPSSNRSLASSGASSSLSSLTAWRSRASRRYRIPAVG
mmetsp:Transcript_28265/g.67211  ORF Transcript_28265/g.67211 Transcript_28265/m.67211 type:complete len:245 (+) Transcript_28265:631-1365(+)